VLGLSARVEEITNPFAIALYSLPKVALAPFFVIFFGIGMESKIALVSVTVFFLRYPSNATAAKRMRP
jgi:NitT/TauT family transport system permease protein